MYGENRGESTWLRRFQSKVIQDLLDQDMVIRKQIRSSICVQERDLESVIEVFLPLHKERFHPIDYALLMERAQFGRELNKGENHKKTIYLDCSSSTGYERMQQRGREGEEMTFEEYHALHERMSVLKTNAEVVLDTEKLSEKDVFDFVLKIVTNE